MSMHQSARHVSPATRLTEAVEASTSLDPVVERMREGAQRLVSSPGRARMLREGPLGHALHPVLTDVPIGAWISAAVLDWTGGSTMQPASRRLVGLGNVAALPTAVTGLAEYAGLDREAQRVASLHAIANNVALGLNTWSWFARRNEQQGLGRVLTVAALAAGGFGAFLGGHLAIGKKVGSSESPPAEHTGGPGPSAPDKFGVGTPGSLGVDATASPGADGASAGA